MQQIHTRFDIVEFLSCRFIRSHTGRLQAGRLPVCGAAAVWDAGCAGKFCICVMFRDIQVTATIHDGRGWGRGETYWKEMADAL